MALTLIEVAQLAKNIAVLSSVPVKSRAQYQVLAVKTLGDLKDHSGILGLAEYAGRLAKVINSDPQATEPWAAFRAGGPGKPPPAVALLRPPEGAPGTWDQLYYVWENWIGPGQMYKILSGQGLPTNGLLDAMKAAVGEAAEVAGDLIKTVVFAALALGGLYLATKDS